MEKIELPIGTKFKANNTNFIVEEVLSISCSGCYDECCFNPDECFANRLVCWSKERSDRKNVIFKKI